MLYNKMYFIVLCVTVKVNVVFLCMHSINLQLLGENQNFIKAPLMYPLCSYITLFISVIGRSRENVHNSVYIFGKYTKPVYVHVNLKQTLGTFKIINFGI